MADRLSEYRSRRDFRKTREPRGKRGRRRRSKLGFYVQKHAARRLHYDLRLEWDGVLLSWAVTKGPSPDPSQKRLAVRTEDHPLSYAEFEGTIPKDEYGGGTVMLWDRGTWEPHDDPDEGLAKGKLSFTVNGDRMQGGWALVHMKGRKSGGRENWLLIKERDDDAGDDPDELTEACTTSVATGRTMDEIAKADDGAGTSRPRRKKSAKIRTSGSSNRSVSGKHVLPAFHKPQLATLTDSIPEGDEWLHESKLDGYRCIAAVGGGETRCYTRSGKDWTDKFASVADALRGLRCDSALLDGEIVAADATPGSAFSSLQAALSKAGRIRYHVFDLLQLDGRDLRSSPLMERKAMLRKLLGELPNSAAVVYSEHVRGRGREVFDAMCKSGLEGIIAKKASSTYQGRRTTTWLKIKCTRRQEFVIGGFTPSDKRGRLFASLMIGTYEDGKLRYRGRVGTGFSEADQESLGELLTAREQRQSPFETVPKSASRKARWIRPLVAEIDYAELTDGGYVRHGAFKGLRRDKKPKEVTLEAPDKNGGKTREEYHGIRLTHPQRIVYPGQGVSKSDLAEYYDAVAPRMLPLMQDHPLSLVRCPKGYGKSGGDDAKCFFQKHASPGFPEALKRVKLSEKSGKRQDYLYIAGVEGLIAAVQMGTLEFHIWGSRVDSPEKPARLVFDLDPDEGLDFGVVRLAATLVRQRLEDLGLKSVPLVTGGKGVHVVVPHRRTAEWPKAKSFARAFAKSIADEQPDAFTATMSKSRRKGRIFLDWMRNERGSTAIAPYSTRAKKNAPIATPVSWKELETLESAATFRMDDVVKRLDRKDPWQHATRWRQSITKPMLDHVAAD